MDLQDRITEIVDLVKTHDTLDSSDYAAAIMDAVREASIIERTQMRYALVSANAASTEQIAAYLPANYAVLGRTPIKGTNTVQILIGGSDIAGWTLDDYVLPRLASGMYYGDEIAGA